MIQKSKHATAKYSQDRRDEWDVKLGELVYAYNTSFQESSKHSPFEVMFRRAARLPVDCNTDKVDANQKLEEYTNLRSPDAELMLKKEMQNDGRLKKLSRKTLSRHNRSKRILPYLI